MSKETRQKEAFSLSKFLAPVRGLFQKKSNNNNQNDKKEEQAVVVDPKSQLRRDFCFATPNGAAYFSTRDEFCLQASGGLFRAFDLLEYGPQHPLRGWRTTVVGERGGRLWTKDEGSNFAYPLSFSIRTAASTIKSKYGFKKVGVNKLEQAADPAGLTAPQKQLLQTLPDLMVQVNNGGRAMTHLTPMLSPDGMTIGWTGVNYMEAGNNQQQQAVGLEVISIAGTATVH
jgi:hypothetical protein